MIRDVKNFEYLLVVDLEATCCNDQSIPRDEMEIIEIGAVMVERDTLKPIGEYDIFVQPVIRPVLTEFCTELTTITQDDVDNAMGFKEAMADFNKFIQAYTTEPVLFCSWGNYDKSQFIADCKLHDVPYPFGDNHINLKSWFSVLNKRNKQYGMKTALRIANIPADGTHHRGIDDARNITKLLPYIVGDKRL